MGDTVSIKYNSKVFDLKIIEAKPADAICIIEADVEVDFAPPPGYVDPALKKKVTPLHSLLSTLFPLFTSNSSLPFTAG